MAAGYTQVRRSVKKVRSGPWNGVFFGGTPKVYNSVFEPILVRNEDEIYYTYRLVNNSVISRLTLNQSGAVERLVMYGQNSEWTTIFSVPVDTCENYGQCGANAICRARKSPICECLQGYRSIPEEELDIQNFYGSRKCETRLTLDCRPGEGFLKLPGVKLPDFIEFRLVESMNLKECEAECFKNCSCSAFANSNISGGGSGCLMWFGNLIDIREQSGSTIGQDIHIRVPASELGACYFSHLRAFLAVQKSARSSKRKKMLKTALVASMSTLFDALHLLEENKEESRNEPLQGRHGRTSEYIGLSQAWLLWNEGRASELIDAGLEDTSEMSQLLRCIQVGLLCVQKLPEDRPVMSTVVFMLANEGAELPQPQQPGFFIERGSVIDSKPRNEDSSPEHGNYGWKRGRRNLTDKTSGDSHALSEIIRYIHVGLLCVQQQPDDRPNMSTAILMLSGESSLPQSKKPDFFPRKESQYG
ncbi:hypothetical protein SADUNF_Sadunf11G0091200 [Salix dunnii]|uniref:Apple domain-containing protein n=1 Tax=Salix dunnii TaxID=1413687 RepID=A0A835JKG5_9ROSI|nr:hypothetical protein SADUNF_Sadunf11G0091200 [Salix dunnii]